MDKIYQYIKLLLKWNEKFNLITIHDLMDLYVNHIIDTLSILEFNPFQNLSICDIGPGAGFPGIILAVFKPKNTYFFFEPKKKYYIFLKKVIEELNLTQVTLINDKIENYSLKTEPFDMILSRAVSDMNLLYAISHKYMQNERTRLFLFKGLNYLDQISLLDNKDALLFLIKKIKTLEIYNKNHYIIGILKGSVSRETK